MLRTHMNNRFDVDALFVVTKELFSTIESKIIDPSYMIDYLNSVKEVLDAIRSAKENVSSEAFLRIRKLEEDIKRLSGLTGEVEENTIDQEETEKEFKNFISTPQLVGTSDTRTEIRKNKPGFNEDRARAE